jgi:hypothetical protein
MRPTSIRLVAMPLALAALVVAACTSGPPPTAETLGTAASALFANGVPCASEGQCTSGFCVDGVCCDTACGGGARDLQACSNVYGKVTGLVDGTCFTLKPGDACGALTTVNPCTWRGTIVNNGNNCPNPPGGSTACFPCTTSGDCSGAFPVCIGGACVQCDGNAGSGTPAACPPSRPICASGECIGCTPTSNSCSGTTPTCNVATGDCAPCTGDHGSGAIRPCPTAAAPACLSTGACGECSGTNATACAGITPSCDTTTNTCGACNGEHGSSATRPCPSFANPHCLGTGACGKCGDSAECTPPLSECQIAIGICGEACSDDSECPATKWCAGGVCVPKTKNGEPIPNVAPVNGDCTPANGARVCASGVCDEADDRCGLVNGADCGPPPTDALCRSERCFPADNKCGLPEGEPCLGDGDCRTNVCSDTGVCATCESDADCGGPTSGKVCDTLQKLCRDGCRGTGGNGCPEGRRCTSTDDTIGRCVECEADSECGDATSGRVCDEGTCKDGCRGSEGNSCPEGQKCSSEDGSIGACGACGSDADCGDVTSGRICEDTSRTCVDGCRGEGGNGCPGGAVCSSTTAAPGTCAFDDDGVLEGGGFSCTMTTARNAGLVSFAFFGLLAGAVARRRRRTR